MLCHASFLCHGMEDQSQLLDNQHTSEVLIPQKGQDHAAQRHQQSEPNGAATSMPHKGLPHK